MMMRRSSALFLLLVLVSPSWIQDGIASCGTPSPSPSPLSAVAESPHHHQSPSIISPISNQAPQMPPSVSPSNAEAPTPQIQHELPSVSPSEPPNMPPHRYNEPPLPSPSPSSSPDHSFRPPSPSPSPSPDHSVRSPSPSPSPISPPPYYHHRHNGPHFKPPPSSTRPQCWSLVMEVNDCSNEIIMAYHGYNRNLKPSCCQAINRTSKNCLFDMLFFRTHDSYFILWLREHCARIAHA